MIRTRILVCALLIGLGNTTASLAETTFFGPVRPYLSAADTPADFFCSLCEDCVTVLEDFEDGTVDHGITIEGFEARVIGPDFLVGDIGATDSVDGDDGDIDGRGNQGHSFFSPANVLTITFASPVTSAGLVWTDGDRGSSTQVEFIGPDGSLGTIGPRFLADSGFQGGTDEDGFFGAKDTDGITSIVIRNIGGSGIEIDHIQFEDCTACIPEPSATILCSLGFAILVLSRRRNS